MDYDLTFTIAEHGRDPEAGERLLDELAAAHPEAGPVVDQNLQTGALSVALTVSAESADEALQRGREAFDAGIERSGLEPSRVLALHVDAVGAAELQPA